MKKIQFIVVITLIVLLFATAFAEGEEKEINTKLEKARSKTGTIIIVGAGGGKMSLIPFSSLRHDCSLDKMKALTYYFLIVNKYV